MYRYSFTIVQGQRLDVVSPDVVVADVVVPGVAVPDVVVSDMASTDLSLLADWLADLSLTDSLERILSVVVDILSVSDVEIVVRLIKEMVLKAGD